MFLDVAIRLIPVGYWFLNMKDFQGSDTLRNIYDQYVEDLRDRYIVGRSICFSGNQGTGKTMSSVCILKEALKQNFSTYYTTASDILNDMTDFRNSADVFVVVKRRHKVNLSCLR